MKYDQRFTLPLILYNEYIFTFIESLNSVTIKLNKYLQTFGSLSVRKGYVSSMSVSDICACSCRPLECQFNKNTLFNMFLRNVLSSNY